METNMKTAISILAILVTTVTLASAQNVTKEEVPGIRNLARLETTVACAGATSPESMAAIKKMGFKSVINLRQATEPGIDLEGNTKAAQTAGLKYFHVPFNGSNPTTAAVDQFLKAIQEPGVEPAFIHCAGGNRAAAMWFIKRAVVDKWDNEKALAEASALGFSNERLKTFALDYISKNRK
jgi:uncharacterized protein (TIGR01244 family)